MSAFRSATSKSSDDALFGALFQDVFDVEAAGMGPSADALQLESGDFILLESGDYLLKE